MHTESYSPWAHDHVFGQDAIQPGERRTRVVIVITFLTMAAEVGAGVAFGSMALLADGLHMGSHASALAVSAFAYWYTRRHARDERFNFGTGKVNSLAAFASAVMLALFALVMAGESVLRLLSPVPIRFGQAILVAAVGLLVNGASLVILGRGGSRHGHGEEPEPHSHSHGPGHPCHQGHNLWSAYLHVLADALTSVLAIAALAGGKYLGLAWLDPAMGIVGAALVTRWAWGLLRSSAHVLLDMRAPDDIHGEVLRALEAVGDNRVHDLHVWSVGAGIFAAEVALVSSSPRSVEDYFNLLPAGMGIVHLTVETRVCPCEDPENNGCPD